MCSQMIVSWPFKASISFGSVGDQVISPAAVTCAGQ